MNTIAANIKRQPANQPQTLYKILIILGLCHLLNDSLQAVVPAMFPILQKSMSLSYTQLGIIAFALNMVSSIMQPIVGWYTDKKPMPFALPIGLTSTLIGIILLALVPSYTLVILSVMLIGIGSAIFHPEGSRVAYMAAGTKRGLAQSIYQVGGNTGQALAPLITALVLVPLGQIGGLWFAPVALTAVLMLAYIANWYTSQLSLNRKKKIHSSSETKPLTKKIWMALAILLFLIFARSWYISCMTNFYAFYLIDNYSFSIRESQIYIFAFLAAGALGTFFGGPLADRFGRRNVILASILGSAPLTILLPYAPAPLAFVMLLLTGFVLMASFSVMVVYAQELVPGKVGTMAGLTVGLAFGMGAMGSVALGSFADAAGMPLTIKLVGMLPLLGLLGLFLPSDLNWRIGQREV
ncbi:MFS transporter [Peribacillus deserti]|uniref:MFS transporter n=1 Tax=Peribacillus deserti TaxID=673318 RepID=A0A2N5M3L0_9BACI|nr:MFS transporter [Peribacillus deserti]PLT28948.1 MFS transporter [Peribacillus deserti]